MIRLYLAGMFLIPLLDWFDRLWERYGVRLHIFDPVPVDKPFIFGVVVDPMPPAPSNSRFVRIKIPFVRTWGYMGFHHGPPWDERSQGFREHYFLWIEGRSPTIIPPFEETVYVRTTKR